MCVAKSSSGLPHARCVQPCPDGWSSNGRVGGSTTTTCGNGAARPGSSSSAAHEVSAKPPTRGARPRARCGACAVTARTGSPDATRSPSSPAMPVPRRSRTTRPPPPTASGAAALAAGPGPSGAAALAAARPARGSLRAARPRGQVAVQLAAHPGRERWRLAEQVDRARAARLRLAEHEPRRDRAVPAVDLQADGGVGGLAGLDRERAARAERDAARAGAAGAERERDVAALAERARVGQARGRDEQRHRRVAGAERRELLELLGQVERQRVALRHRVDAHLRHRGPRASSTSAACARNASRNASTSARAIVSPAAARWPP